MGKTYLKSLRCVFSVGLKITCSYVHPVHTSYEHLCRFSQNKPRKTAETAEEQTQSGAGRGRSRLLPSINYREEAATSFCDGLQMRSYYKGMLMRPASAPWDCHPRSVHANLFFSNQHLRASSGMEEAERNNNPCQPPSRWHETFWERGLFTLNIVFTFTCFLLLIHLSSNTTSSSPRVAKTHCKYRWAERNRAHVFENHFRNFSSSQKAQSDNVTPWQLHWQCAFFQQLFIILQLLIEKRCFLPVLHDKKKATINCGGLLRADSVCKEEHAGGACRRSFYESSSTSCLKL